MVKGYESGGERVHPLHPPAFGIWQSIMNPNSFIHSFTHSSLPSKFSAILSANIPHVFVE